MGKPEARLFFDPQKTTAASSAASKPRFMAANRPINITRKSSAKHSAIASTTEAIGKLSQSPLTTEWLNAE